ncbi:hypothetical protein ACOMHN_046948 [Nucella lapillus]
MHLTINLTLSQHDVTSPCPPPRSVSSVHPTQWDHPALSLSTQPYTSRQTVQHSATTRCLSSTPSAGLTGRTGSVARPLQLEGEASCEDPYTFRGLL